MSDANWTVQRTVDFLGVRKVADFRLRTYVIVVPGREELVEKSIEKLARLIPSLGTEAFSDEFEYHRTGFLVCNVGRRGVTLLLYHFGTWVDTPEVFQLSWYRYDNKEDFYLLNSAEPVSCYIDSPVIISELSLWRGLARAQVQMGNAIDFERLYQQYLAAEAVTSV